MSFDSAGVPIHYIERGAGTPVVLVHSYGGDLESQWIETGVLDALARGHRVIALDVRGHGKSGKPHDPEAYGAEIAWDIVRLLDHLGIPKAHIAGYSMGAHIVALLLTLAPERCLSATLGGASGRRKWTAEDDRRTQVEADEMERGMLNSQIVRLRAPGTPTPRPETMRELSEQFLEGKDRYALAALRRSNQAQVVTPAQMQSVRVPVLGVVGSKDPYRASFDELKQLIPAMTLVVLDGATHVNAPVHPGFVPAIEDFLRRNQPQHAGS